MSTKSTLLCKDNWHLYHDYKDLQTHLEVDNAEVELPASFLEAISDMYSLHEAMKMVLRKVKALDNYDGGLFAVNLEDGTVEEFK